MLHLIVGRVLEIVRLDKLRSMILKMGGLCLIPKNNLVYISL